MATASQPGKINCPHCGGMMKSAGLAVGTAVSCPKCGKGFRVEEGSGVEGRKSKVAGRGTASRRQESEDRRQTGRPERSVPGTPYSVPSTNATQPAAPSASTASPAAASTGTEPKSKIQNPKSPPPSPRRDELVDPNLLAPPPPRAKPKLQEVPVVCHVCGTRVYAKLDKIGQEVKCPDCYSRLVVPPLKEASEAGPGSGGPTLEGAEEFAMSEVVERPKYRPLQAPRGEYEVLSALDPATMEYRLTVPGERPKAKGRVTVQPVDEEDGPAAEGAGEEIALGPEVERVQYAPDPRSILPNPQIEEADALYDGRYDDGLIGDGVDPRSPDAWKKAPLLYGIVGFLFYPSTLLRWAGFAAGLAMVASLVRVAVEMILAGSAYFLFLLWGGIPLAATWLFSFAAAMYSVVGETGNGDDEIETWPDWNVFAWFVPAAYLCIAAFVAAVPGGLISALTFAGSYENPAMAAFGIAAPVLLSWMLLFPLVLYSMLAEDSMFAVFSRQVVHTLHVAGDAWVIFYMYSILIFLFGGLGAGLLAAENLVVRAVAAIGVIALVLVYLRLLGRLMWVANQRLAKSGYQDR